MGITGRKHFLPAPTESLVESVVEDTGPSTEIATDVSRRTDRTSATIPDDGSPLTIATSNKQKLNKLTKIGNSSQTSLLIEYYEGVKEAGSNRRPSLRVRVRPSAGKSKEARDGHIVVTQGKGSRKSSISQRIPLNSRNLQAAADDESVSSLEELEPGHTRSVPIDIEIDQKDSDISAMSGSPEIRYINQTSDISSMPPDSMLGMSAPVIYAPPTAVSNLSKSDLADGIDLKASDVPKERNMSNERITQRAMEKLNSKQREVSNTSNRSSRKSRTRGQSEEIIGATSGERPRRSARNIVEESEISGITEPSVLSNSLLSVGGKSADGQSVRSGASNITNPKLLQTVEDAIRRLILPELKEIKRNGSQRVQTKDEYAYDEISDNSIAREKAGRRVSSGSRSRRRASQGSGGGSASRRRDRQYEEVDYDSPSDISSPRKQSVSSVGVDRERRQRSRETGHRSRDLVAGAAAGAALTSAALQHQDSSSTLDRERRRRRRRSKSRSSRSASIAEDDEAFDKHDVPPMPFTSEVGTDLTRSSLLSSNTAGTTTPTHREVREVVRGAPLESRSPMPQTPTRNSGDLKHTLGTHFKNVSGHDLNRASYEDQLESPEAGGDYSPEYDRERSFSNLADPERVKAYERNLHQQHPIRRGLSPIQSVASYAPSEPNRNSMMQARSIDSLKRQQELREEVSIGSFSSAKPYGKKQGRPHGINSETLSETMQGHDDTLLEEDERDLDDDVFYDEQHDENERYRESYDSTVPKSSNGRLSNYGEYNRDSTHYDKITEGQHVADVFESNPEYVHTPPGVESAVASLVDPSVLDIQASQSRHSLVESLGQGQASPTPAARGIDIRKSGSPLKEQTSAQSYGGTGKSRHIISNRSPPQSPARSFEEDMEEVLHVEQSNQKDANSPESEITTNPSVIQGPIADYEATNHNHWPYGPTPDHSTPQSPIPQALSRDLDSQATDLMPPRLNVSSQRNTYDAKPDMYHSEEMTPGAKDEGYHTSDNPRSPEVFSKQINRDDAFTPEDMVMPEDPFTTGRDKYVSGLSQGMSPWYDGATGRGIDHIQSKDIVALMDHLTVRDAQRNARDTEILVTLVRSAAEMRNSFEDMKKFIAEQDDLIMDTTERQHEKTQKVVGGPRPLPARGQKMTTSQEESPDKRRNIFKRALQGLGSKNAAELQNIEQMLVQLLGEVEGLKHTQNIPTSRTLSTEQGTTSHDRSVSINSVDHTRAAADSTYHQDGKARSSSSTPDQRGFVPTPQPSGQPGYTIGSNKDTVNRISTVGGDDYFYDNYEGTDDGEEGSQTPRAGPADESQYRQATRGQSVPVETPQKMYDPNHGRWSNENTPRHVNEPNSGRKHKSIASSFLPSRLISRWSKTTASTDPRHSTQPKQRPYSGVSHSGSDFGEYAYEPQPDDRLRSNTSLQNEQYREQENRPPSPLVPSQVSENPKYQGYRNSTNLQHPQPRQGPTGRYQYKLESEAQNYHDEFSPSSQVSNQWETKPMAGAQEHNYAPQQERYVPQAPLSPISDTGHSEVSERSQRSMGRSSKLMDNDPLVPRRTPQGPLSPSNYVDHVAAARAGSPAYDQSPVSALRSPHNSGRKPSGPRPLSSNGKAAKGDLNTIKKTRFRGSPYQIDSEEDVSRY